MNAAARFGAARGLGGAGFDLRQVGAKESALSAREGTPREGGGEMPRWARWPAWDGSLPILDHQLKLFHQGVDLFEIFAAPFLRFEIQGATKGDHVAQITDGVL